MNKLCNILKYLGNQVIAVRRSDLETSLLSFYDDVLGLIQPSMRIGNSNRGEPRTLPYNLLVVFCLLFRYNLVNNNGSRQLTTTNFNLGHNSEQVRHVMSQVVRAIEENYNEFADRIKIIYFLLIMFVSYGQHQHEQRTDGGVNNENDDRYAFLFSEDTNEIQRTFLDLLNSELDYQDKNVAGMRVSLLLKLDQFI